MRMLAIFVEEVLWTWHATDMQSRENAFVASTVPSVTNLLILVYPYSTCIPPLVQRNVPDKSTSLPFFANQSTILILGIRHFDRDIVLELHCTYSLSNCVPSLHCDGINAVEAVLLFYSFSCVIKGLE
jgi:hypothetical protein